MAQQTLQTWRDFAVYTIGTNAPGYTVRGGGAPTFKPRYSAPDVQAYKRTYLEFLTDATTDYHAVSVDLFDADPSRNRFNVLAGFAMDLQTVEELHIYARGVGTATMTEFVRARIVLATGNIYIDQMVAGVYTAGSGTSAGNVTLTAGHAYVVRLKGLGGDVSLKVVDAALGKAGEAAAAFNLTPTGITASANGWVALGGRHSTLTGKVAAFNYLSARFSATAADTPCPRTNAERRAWRADPNATRAVMAVMPYVKYDSSGSPYTGIGKFHVSNHGYNSHEQDSPALQPFDNFIIGLPTFSRELPAALSGQGSTSIGKLRLKNPGAAAQLLQNRILRSEGVDNAAWTKSNLTAAANVAAAYDGVVRADSITENTAVNVFHDLVQSGGTMQAGCIYRITQKFKANGRTKGQLGFYNNVPFGGTYPIVTFDLTAITASGSGGATGASIVDKGGGWYQVSFVAQCTVTTAAVPMFARLLNAAGSGQYTGDGVSGMYVDQAHYHDARASSVYVTTVSSIVDQFTVANPTAVPGVRDDLARVHWLRNGFEMYYGDPSWPLTDCDDLVRGRLGIPTAPDPEALDFPIADMSEFFNRPIQDDLITSGEYAGQRKPKLFGNPALVEPPKTDVPGNKWQVSDGYWASGGEDVLDEGFSLVTDIFTVIAVNTGTGEITLDAPHGWVDGYRMRFIAGTPPLGQPLDTDRHIVGTTPGSDKFKIALTAGAAPITGGAGTTGAAALGLGWRADNATGELILPADNAGRVMVLGPSHSASGTDNTTPDIYAAVAFDAMGLSLNHKDSASFDALKVIEGASLGTHGFWYDSQVHLGKDVLLEIAKKTYSWFTMTLDGLMQVGNLGLPSGTPALSLTASEIKWNSMRLVDIIRPIDFEKTQITYAPWLVTGGPLANYANLDNGLAQQALQLKSFLAAYSYGAPSTPLDDHPELSDPDVSAQIDLATANQGCAEYIQERLAALYQRQLGVFEFETTLPAFDVPLGATIRVEFPRLGWKAWSATDPASPDNSAAIDSTLCVVLKCDTNLSETSPFQVKLKVIRPMPGLFPTANLN